MKITIQKDKLAEALAAVKEVVAKDAISQFSRVRLDAAASHVTLAASNGDIDVSMRVAGHSDSSGLVFLPGTPLMKFAAALGDGAVTIAANKDSRASIDSADGVHFKLATTKPLPAMVPPGEKAKKIYLPAMAAGEMLRKVAWAAGKNAARQILCGVNVKLHDRLLEMTATDGRRLGHVEYTLDEETCAEAGGFDFTLPNAAVAMMRSRLVGADGELTIFADAQKAMFVHDDWCISAKVAANAYPNWRRAVPEGLEHLATIARRPFLRALNTVALAAGEENAVKLTIENGKADFAAKNEFAESRMSIDQCAVPSGGKMTAMFNSRLVADALEVIDAEEFTLEFGDKPGAVVVKANVPWMAVVMPLNGND